MQNVHTRMLVDCFDECFIFYKESLGLKLTWGKLREDYASFETVEGSSFSIFSRKAMALEVGTSELSVTSEAQDRFALIFRVVNLEDIVKHLQTQGISMVNNIQDRHDWGIRTVHLRNLTAILLN